MISYPRKIGARFLVAAGCALSAAGCTAQLSVSSPVLDRANIEIKIPSVNEKGASNGNSKLCGPCCGPAR